MSSDFESLASLAKVFLDEKKSENVDTYSFSMFIGEFENNFTIMKKLAEEKIFFIEDSTEVRRYQKFIKHEGEEGKKLFEDMIRYAIEKKK